MKNRNGFVISTMIYSIFGIMIIIAFYILYILSNNKVVFMSNIENLKSGLEKDKINVVFVMDQGLSDNERTLYINKIKSFSSQVNNKNIGMDVVINDIKTNKYYISRNGVKELYDDAYFPVYSSNSIMYYYGIIGNKVLYSAKHQTGAGWMSTNIYMYDVMTETIESFTPQYNGTNLSVAGFKNDPDNNLLYIYGTVTVLSPTGISTLLHYYVVYEYDNEGNLTKSDIEIDSTKYNALPFSVPTGESSGPFLYDPNPDIILNNGFNNYLSTSDRLFLRYTSDSAHNHFGQYLIFKMNDKYGVINYRQSGYNSNAGEMFMVYFTPEHIDETLEFSSSSDESYKKKYYIILKRDNINKWNYYNFTVGDSFTVDNLQDYHKFVIAGEKSTEIIQSKLNGASNIEYYDYDYDNNFTNLDTIFNKILEEL